MLGKTLDGEIKLLRIRELDNNDVDVKPDSTDEDTPPNLKGGWNTPTSIYHMNQYIFYNK